METRRTTAMHLTRCLWVATAVLMSGACLAKDNSRESALRAAELARFKATVDNDAAALDRLLDADLDYTHSDGVHEGKARFIQALSDGTRDYVSFEPTVDQLRLVGNVGLILGHAKVSVTGPKGPSSFEISYDEAWLWKDGRWQMATWRSSRPPATPSPARSEDGAKQTILGRFDAALHADTAALDRVLADDLQYCNYQGECEGKQQYIGEVKSGALRYESIEPRVDGVKLFTDTAAVLGEVSVTATRNGVRRHIRASYLAVLVWRSDRWQLTSWSSTLLEPVQVK